MFVKICGTTSEDDALLAVALGADAIGFIFATSPRQITPEQAGDIIKRLPPEVLTVGVFRNETNDRILKAVMTSGVRAVQLHGFEDTSQLDELRAKLPLVLIKAFSASNPEVRRADEYGADMVLLDAPSPGSGQVFDWRLAEGIPDGIRLLLAGGLNPDNVAEAIEAVHPFGVDVVSGVESQPGIKDPRKLRAFIANAKATQSQPYEGTADAPFDWNN